MPLIHDTLALGYGVFAKNGRLSLVLAVQDVLNYYNVMLDSDFIGQVERALPDALSGAGRLGAAARYLACAPGAKRLRPLMALRVGQMCKIAPSVLLDLAVAVELIHSASLLHDDIVDDGKLRRGAPTVNALQGNTTAVLSGDLVLSRALSLLAPYKLTERAVAVVEEMTLSAFAEVNARGDASFPLAAWRKMAEGKSGALFGLSGALVALHAGQRDLAERLDAMGRHLGVAFQIADDISDTETDARDGTPSFMLLVQAQGATAEEARNTSLEAIAHEVASARLAMGAAASHPALGEIWAWAEALSA